jgi:hypothetical protein
MALMRELPVGPPQSWSDMQRYPCSARLFAQFEAVGGWIRPTELPDCVKQGDILPLLNEMIDAVVEHEQTLPEDAPVLVIGLWDMHDPLGKLGPHSHIEAYPGQIPQGQCRIDRLEGTLRWWRAFRVKELPPFWRVTEFDGQLPFPEIAVASAAAWAGRWALPGEDLCWPASRFGLHQERKEKV